MNLMERNTTNYRQWAGGHQPPKPQSAPPVPRTKHAHVDKSTHACVCVASEPELAREAYSGETRTKSDRTETGREVFPYLSGLINVIRRARLAKPIRHF